MKKFLTCMLLTMIAMTVSAMAQMKAYGLPEQDIGYEQVATLSLDGLTVVSFVPEINFVNIVDLQTPVMLIQESEPSAQVVDACSARAQGEISTTLDCYRWPGIKSECVNYSTIYSVPHSRYSHNSFTTAHTEIL